MEEKMDLYFQMKMNQLVMEMGKKYPINLLRDLFKKYLDEKSIEKIFQEEFQYYDSLCDDYWDL